MDPAKRPTSHQCLRHPYLVQLSAADGLLTSEQLIITETPAAVISSAVKPVDTPQPAPTQASIMSSSTVVDVDDITSPAIHAPPGMGAAAAAAAAPACEPERCTKESGGPTAGHLQASQPPAQLAGSEVRSREQHAKMAVAQLAPGQLQNKQAPAKTAPVVKAKSSIHVGSSCSSNGGKSRDGPGRKAPAVAGSSRAGLAAALAGSHVDAPAPHAVAETDKAQSSPAAPEPLGVPDGHRSSSDSVDVDPGPLSGALLLAPLITWHAPTRAESVGGHVHLQLAVIFPSTRLTHVPPCALICVCSAQPQAHRERKPPASCQRQGLRCRCQLSAGRLWDRGARPAAGAQRHGRRC